MSSLYHWWLTVTVISDHGGVGVGTVWGVDTIATNPVYRLGLVSVSVSSCRGEGATVLPGRPRHQLLTLSYGQDNVLWVLGWGGEREVGGCVVSPGRQCSRLATVEVWGDRLESWR